MDTESLIAHARARFDHVAARRVLKEKYQARMMFAYNGGMWRAGPENPIRIHVGDLELATAQRWQEQMNAWLVEFEQNQSYR